MMASSLTDAAAALVLAAQNHVDTSYVTISMVALLFYDYLLTVEDEFQWIWQKKKSGGSFLYIVNRYFAIFNNIILLFAEYSSVFDKQSICAHVVFLEGIGTVLQILLAQVMITLRVYAVWKGNVYVLGTLVACLLAQLGTLIYTTHFVIAIQPPPNMPFLIGCIAAAKPQAAPLSKLYALLPFAFDSIASILLVYAIFFHKHVRRERAVTGLLQVMLQDGATYFLALCLCNMAFLVTLTTFKDEREVILAPLTQTIAVVLTNRMLINIRSYRIENLADVESSVSSYRHGATAWIKSSLSE